MEKSPGGTKEKQRCGVRFCRPSGTRLPLESDPSAEALGYFQMQPTFYTVSKRPKNPRRIAKCEQKPPEIICNSTGFFDSFHSLRMTLFLLMPQPCQTHLQRTPVECYFLCHDHAR